MVHEKKRGVGRSPERRSDDFDDNESVSGDKEVEEQESLQYFKVHSFTSSSQSTEDRC